MKSLPLVSVSQLTLLVSSVSFKKYSICMEENPPFFSQPSLSVLHKWLYGTNSLYIEIKIKGSFGLPWWRSGWESACQCRGHGFEPWSGKIPHAVEQLGPWATTTEPARLELVLCNKRGPRTTMKSSPRSLQLEKALAQKRRPNTAINK